MFKIWQSKPTKNPQNTNLHHPHVIFKNAAQTKYKLFYNYSTFTCLNNN